jgi:hypothetical protein
MGCELVFIDQSQFQECNVRKIVITFMQCLMLIMCRALPAQVQQASVQTGLDTDGLYRVVENWFKPGVKRWNQPVTGVAIDNPNLCMAN